MVLLILPISLLHNIIYKDTKIEKGYSHRIELLNGWEYQWADSNTECKIPESGWKSISRPINPPNRNQHCFLWLRIRMPSGNWEAPALLINGKGVLLTFKAFIGDQMIYQFGKLNPSGRGNFSGISSHLIHLENKFGGKNLTFRVFSDYANIGIRGKVILGSESDLMRRIIRKDYSRLIIGFFMVFIGILDLIAYKEITKITQPISMFGILSTSIGLYIIHITTIKDIIFYAPVFWFNVYIAAMTLIPVGAMGFIWQTFRPTYGNLYHRVWQFHLWYAVVCETIFLLILGSILPMAAGSIALNTLRILLILEFCLIVGICAKDAFIKRNLLASIYLIGIAPIIFSGIHDALVGLGKIESSYSFVPWAIMFLILSLETIKRRQDIKTRNRLKTYADELEIKSKEKIDLVTELHDGIGGLITSIKFLSEMGIKNPSVESMKEILSNISKLSSDSLVEIASFMQSLDEQETDWSILVENLYQTGKKMIKPLGASFDFKKTMDPSVKKPSSVLFLNLLRIYKEALTNIVKHSEAKHVFIKINITNKKIILSIKDDGKGFAKNVVKGRGLASMKVRAQKLNGALSIHSEGGTSLLIELMATAPV
jgi:signal transduction histidine kinase